ncbi:MAG TPA: hypothetical protein VI547_09960 [Anaerolineales bacterium]|nr:hypothetical protein [Anaerolineales bacterium]
MRHILFLFLDGIGLGEDNPTVNPFARAELPTLHSLVDGRRLLNNTPTLDNSHTHSLFIPTDASMGVSGPPQSATGQATLLTGLNVPALVGGHWGPKPNEAVAAILRRDNIFKTLTARGQSAVLINAYPKRYFDSITSGRRMYSAIPMAVDAAGIPLMTANDLRAGRAFSADFTGEGWRGGRPSPTRSPGDRRSSLPSGGLGYTDTPVYTLPEAGAKLAEVSRQRAFTFFEHWITDFVGHRGTVAEGAQILERFDAMVGGLLANWDHENGLVVITSDHGNLEDLSHSHHTVNKVPTFVIGHHRAEFAHGLTDLTGFTPAILNFLSTE